MDGLALNKPQYQPSQRKSMTTEHVRDNDESKTTPFNIDDIPD
jgi:hypothetical protein